MPLFLAGLHLYGFCYESSDGSKVCVPHVGESSKVRTYEIHKNLTDIFLKNCLHRYKARRNKEALLDVILTLYLNYRFLSSVFVWVWGPIVCQFFLGDLLLGSSYDLVYAYF